MTDQIYNKNSISKVAKKIIQELKSQSRIWTMEGEMGAGKTTLTTALLREMGFDGDVTSPTYTIIQEYPLDNGLNVYHMDWYRIGSAEELWEIGIDEYLERPDSLVIIEWPDIYLDEIRNEAAYIRLDKISENERRFRTGLYKQ